MKRRRKAKQDTLLHGNRYDKSQWEPVVRKMWDSGALYQDIANRLGTTRSTVARFAWNLGLASKETHRHSLRHSILSARDQKSGWAHLKKIDK